MKADVLNKELLKIALEIAEDAMINFYKTFQLTLFTNFRNFILMKEITQPSQKREENTNFLKLRAKKTVSFIANDCEFFQFIFFIF